MPENEQQRRKPLCAHPALFLLKNYPDIILHLEGRRVVFRDPQQRPGLAEYVREVEPFLVEDLAKNGHAARHDHSNDVRW